MLKRIYTSCLAYLIKCHIGFSMKHSALLYLMHKLYSGIHTLHSTAKYSHIQVIRSNTEQTNLPKVSQVLKNESSAVLHYDNVCSGFYASELINRHVLVINRKKETTVLNNNERDSQDCNYGTELYFLFNSGTFKAKHIYQIGSPHMALTL